MLSPMSNSTEAIVLFVAIVLAIVAVVIVDGGLVVSILVGGGVAAVVGLVGVLALGKKKRTG